MPNYVLDGKNGYLLPLSSKGEDFGKKIKECLESGELERMSKSCEEVYRTILNWDIWGKKTARVLMETVKESCHGKE